MILKVDWKLILNVKLNSVMKEGVIRQTRIYSCFFSTEFEMEDFCKLLSEDEFCTMNVVKCKSHQPILLCVVNESHSIKKHFCEKELGSDPNKSFFIG